MLHGRTCHSVALTVEWEGQWAMQNLSLHLHRIALHFPRLLVGEDAHTQTMLP